MSLAVIRITERIMDQLSRREMRLLSLVVAIRRDFGEAEGFKGDLTESVKSALRRLVATKVVLDLEGLYALAAVPAAPVCSMVETASRGRRGHA